MQANPFLTGLSIGPYSIFYVFAVVLVLVMGLLVYFRDTQNLTNLAFAAISLSVSLWLGPHFFYQSLPANAQGEFIASLFARIEYTGVASISLTYCFFILAFLRIINKNKLLFGIAIVNSIIFTSITLFSPDLLIKEMTRYNFPLFSSWYVRYTVLGYVFVAIFIAIALQTFYILLTHYFRSREGLRKKQMRNFLLAYSVAYLGITDFLSCFGLPLQPIGAFAILLYSLLMIRGFLREKTFDLRALVMGNLHRLMAAMLIYMPAIILFRATNLMLRLRTLDPLIFLGMVIVALALLRPLYSMVRDRLNNGLFKNFLNLDQHYRLILDQLKTMNNLEEMLTKLKNSIQSAIQTNDCRILLASKMLVSGSQRPSFPSNELAPQLLSWLHSHKGLTIETKDVLFLARFQPIRDELLSFMKELNTDCLIPVSNQEEIIAMVCLGSKAGGADLTTQEKSFLDNTMREAAFYLTSQLAAETRLDQLTRIYRLGQEFLACSSLGSLTRLATQRTMDLFSAANVSLLAYQPETCSCTGINGTSAASKWTSWLNTHPEQWASGINQPQPLVICSPDNQQDTCLILLRVSAGSSPEINTQLGADVIMLLEKPDNPPDAEELRYISLLASLLGQSMEIRRYADGLESRLEERTRQIHQKNLALTDSLNYAQRIQTAVLPSDSELQSLLGSEHFRIWKPRDIVGGDFYWCQVTKAGTGWLIVGDCTGHGVPGALMSMLAISLLNREKNNLDPRAPHLFLEEFNKLIMETLNRLGTESKVKDGMDMLALHIDGDAREINWSGARLGIYHCQADGQISTIKGSNRSIGDRKRQAQRSFQHNKLKLGKGDSIYLTSDGYLDQNGGARGFSFGRQRFVSLISNLKALPMSKQASLLEGSMYEYAHGIPQRDDILVIGFMS
ncbi:MAG: hypothetical protein D6B26_05155 [Spirochaetaceae bacterium]|nr:MAG: hypothetical protein D6B26_05155 [Spirochaetaceae bacterium]